MSKTNGKDLTALAKAVTSDAKALGAAIKAIATAAGKLIKQINLAAAGCVLHAVETGNVTPARDLIAAVGDGMRRNALRQWFEVYGPFVYESKGQDENGKDNPKNLHYDKERAKVFMAELKKDKIAFCSALMAEPWAEFTKEPEYQGFNFKAALNKLIATGKRHAKQHPDDDRVDITGLEEAEAFVATLDAPAKKAA